MVVGGNGEDFQKNDNQKRYGIQLYFIHYWQKWYKWERHKLELIYSSPKEFKTLIGYLKKIKCVAYSSQGSLTGQLDFCNWLADDSTIG